VINTNSLTDRAALTDTVEPLDHDGVATKDRMARRAIPLIIAAPFSAIMMIGAFVLVEVTAGMTEASITRGPSSTFIEAPKPARPTPRIGSSLPASSNPVPGMLSLLVSIGWGDPYGRLCA
jgi:hypothetical protein